jgi:hypothetical protein
MPLSVSIDTYMDDHRTDPRIELCGRLAIVKSILEAEHNSKHEFFTDMPQGQLFRVDFNKLAPTWFARFFKILRVPKETLSEVFENVSIVNFNYDRSVEFFLTEALRTYYKLSEEDAQHLLLKLRIVHPYGTVGPWHEGTDHLPFGEVVDSLRLLHLAPRIRTYTESSKHSEDARRIVREAQRMIFLGFGYIAENNRLLGPDDVRSTQKIYGTAYSISESDQAVIRWHLGRFLASANPGPAGQPPIMLFSGKCAGLFDEHLFGIGPGI